MIKVLELFAGSRSIGKAAEAQGLEVFSVDVKQWGNIDLVKDINKLELKDVPFIPDIVWSGTPCTTYSIAAISHHRNPDLSPKSEFSFFCDEMNMRVNRLIEEWMRLNPSLLWYIENPRGALRKMPFMKPFDRATVWYCQYGDNRAKPTDIFTNNLFSLFNPEGWKPRPECWNGRKNCHDPAPRGSKTGTQGLKNNHERSKMPEQLCKEIIDYSIKKLTNDLRPIK